VRQRGLTPARLGVVAVVVALVILVDQISKSLAQDHLARGPVHLLGPVSLQLTFNSGAAFSVGAGLSPYLVVVVVVVVLAVLVFTTSLRSGPAAVGAGLVLGGALSNLADRLLRANHGQVIDWIHLSHWPTFNLADSAVVVGVAVLLLWGRPSPGRSGSHR
jgi:signal peptidase II